jgi:hypothetical protein
MNEEIRLNRIGTAFAELDLAYPVTPPAVADACDGVVVRLAEGTVDADEVIAGSNADRFTSSGDVELEFLNLLPRDAVGEPYQSDGDA